ncbi:MAG TPA: sensor histidine kinase [Burkholderiaceae bacterium]|nr:sensor histidine kinase [Burkholderiaceae bacterium]
MNDIDPRTHAAEASFLDGSRADRHAAPAEWLTLLDQSTGPACLVDAALNAIAVNAAAAQAGLTPGAGIDHVLAALAEARPVHDAPRTVRWQRIGDHRIAGWLVEACSEEPGTEADLQGESGAATTHRLGANNLHLQEEIGRRRKLERQILAVAESEKQRISLELHDGLGQHLTGVSFVARTLADRLGSADHAEAKEAEWLVKLLNEAIIRTRALARGLWPVSLERDTIAHSIHKLGEDLESIFGVSCTVQIVDEPRIPSQFAAHHVFRIVQEAATNAIKHGHARRLTFRLEIVGDDFVFCVINDGLPLDPAQLAAGEGLGVVGMRLRAEAVGGHLSIEPLPSGGSEVTLALPGVAGMHRSCRGDQP